jgi:hypothetical protein
MIFGYSLHIYFVDIMEEDLFQEIIFFIRTIVRLLDN